MKGQQASPLAFGEKDWKALNHKVRAELKAGKGKAHANPQAFLADLKRRMTKALGRA